MNKNMLFNLVLSAMIIITVVVLGAIGETRLDVYISLFTLEYFIGLAVLRPRRRTLDFLAISLLVVFIIIVGIRVVEIILT
ncbi:MAG: hypothetical protein QXL22_00870 [Candidatus Nezhaarchaeales archaeon]